MKKKLLITSTDLMMVQFLIPHVRNLSDRGYAVELACADVGGRMGEIQEKLPGIPLHPVRAKRNPLSLTNILGYFDLRRRIRQGAYPIIWTNEPVMGALTRLAAVGTGAKVVYLCHGFHFYRGCPPASLIFYPVEKFLSRWTDRILTINREDEAAAGKFHAGSVGYLPGLGVDPDRLLPETGFREELGIKSTDFLLLCVGELNKNKNHRLVLEALAILRDPDIHLCLCGKGPLEDELKARTSALGLERKVHFPGYRRDMGRVYAGADLMIHPSRREGLGLAPLEGMYAGLPLLASDIRGPRDYCGPEFRFPPDDLAALAALIAGLKTDEALRRRCGEENRRIAAGFTLEIAGQALLRAMEDL